MISSFSGIAKDLLRIKLIRQSSNSVDETTLFDIPYPNCLPNELKDFVRKFIVSKQGNQNVYLWPDLAIVFDASGSEVLRWSMGDELAEQNREDMGRHRKERKAIMDNDKAMEEGKLAASQGEKASSNPYPDDSDEWGHWEEGFNFVKDSDEDGEPGDE